MRIGFLKRRRVVGDVDPKRGGPVVLADWGAIDSVAELFVAVVAAFDRGGRRGFDPRIRADTGAFGCAPDLDLDVAMTADALRIDRGSVFAAERMGGTGGVSRGAGPGSVPVVGGALGAEPPILLPMDVAIRSGIQAQFARRGLKPRIAADVDDICDILAIVRLLAREGAGVAAVPSLVLANELETGLLASAPFDLGVTLPFFTVTIRRRLPHPALEALFSAHPEQKTPHPGRDAARQAQTKSRLILPRRRLRLRLLTI